MRKSVLTISSIAALLLFAGATNSAAQDASYNLVEIPTLGGPGVIGQVDGLGISQFINHAGVVVGGATTSMLDPTVPGCADCFIIHGFRWESGVLTDLGTLPGGNFSHATSVNARGWATGGSFTSATDPLTGSPTEHAVLWKDGEIIDLGTLPGGINSAGLYVNNAGQVVGFSTVDTSRDPFMPGPFGPFPSSTHAFIWSEGVMRDLGTLGGPDSFASGGCDNQRTDLVAGASFTSATANPNTGFPTTHPFLWKEGTLIDLGSLGGTVGFSQCANNRGQVIGQSNLAGDVDQHAFLWEQGSMNDLGTLGGGYSAAIWLNGAGEAVGGATTGDDEFHATIWRDGKIHDLGMLPGDCASIAVAVNAAGQILGESFNCDTETLRAVLWDNGTIFDLNAAIAATSTFRLAEAFNINDRGEIVGRALAVRCDNGDACGQIFLLIPCGQSGAQSCNRDVSAAGIAGTTPAFASATRNRQQVKDVVSSWRSRLTQRYSLPLSTPYR